MCKRFFLSVLLTCICVVAPRVSSAAEKVPVLMIGDSMMRLLGVAMEKELKASGIQPASSYSSLASGLARMDAFDWFAKVESLMSEYKPAIVVVTLGANDRQALKDSTGRVVQFGSAEWEKEDALRVGRIMDELIKGGAHKIIWLLLPDMKAPVQQAYAQFVNTLFIREATAETRKDKIVLYDMRPLLSRKPGTFSLYMMAPNGAALTVRDVDGIHLTNPGAQRVAQALVQTYWK